MANKRQLVLLSSLIFGVFLFSVFINLKPVPTPQPQVLAITTVLPESVPSPSPKPLPPVPVISATSYLVRQFSGETLVERNSLVRLSPASTTKMMTALVAVNNFPLNSLVTINKIYNVGAVINLEPGEVISLENLLYGLLLNSGNDAAMAISSGLENPDNFIALMNQEVSDLGLEDTQFVNPSGLDHPDHYSSAYDLSKIAEAVLSNPDLAKIVSTQSTTIYDVNRQIAHHLENRNKLLSLPGVIGVKTGYTDTAGEVLVTAVTREENIYIIVVMGSLDRFSDTKQLIDWLDQYLESPQE